MNLGSEDACQCGCRGWCTYFVLLLALSWDLCACAAGIFDSKNQYDELFNTTNNTEDIMADQAGKSMGFLVAILDLMTDWPAWTSWSGMRQWAHDLHPCPKCNIKKILMHSNDSVQGVSLSIESGPWEDYTHKDYEQDLNSHLVATCCKHTCKLLFM